MRHIFAFILVILTSLAVTAGDAVKMPVAVERDGYHMAFVDAGKAYVAGQPTEDALRALASEGVKTIVNLRTPTEMAALGYDEAALVSELGMTYVSIPLGGKDNPYSPEAVAEFIKAVEASEGKVMLHCASGRRASHVWGAYLVKAEGMSRAEAEAHTRAVGRGEPALDKLLSQE